VPRGYQSLARPQEAIVHLEAALAILEDLGPPQDAGG